jgi:putative transposase
MNTKSHCYLEYIILQTVYFKLRFTLSYRDIEEIMNMRGVQVDHATIQLRDVSLHLLLSYK